PVRVVLRQRPRVDVAARARRRRRARRLSRLHEPAMAPADGIHRAHVDQPRRRAVDHAAAHAGGNGPTGARGRLSQNRDGDRPLGHLLSFARGAGGVMKIAAAKTSARLSLLFLAVYGGCNWIAALRGNAGEWYFAWV